MSTTSTISNSSVHLPKVHLSTCKSQKPDSFSYGDVYNAYCRLTHDQLVLFLSLRSLPTVGSDAELASRLTHFDLHLYHLPNKMANRDNAQTITSTFRGAATVPNTPVPSASRMRQQPSVHSRLPDLPTEILVQIVDLLDDWELCKAVGLPTTLSRPHHWIRASSTDEAMLHGFVPLIRSSDPVRNPPTKVGASLTIRFGYVHVLDTLLHCYRSQFTTWFTDDIIPVAASQHGRTEVLSWWKHTFESQLLPRPSSKCISQSIEVACKAGKTSSLDWWLASRLPLSYGEAALEQASSKNHVAVLDWWLRSKLPFKVGRVMDLASIHGHVDVLSWWFRSGVEFKYDRNELHHASMQGKVDVLQWWLDSGLQMIFDQDALTLATRHNRPEVLDWWDKSGLPVQYRICDIEEALEDAIGGGEAARKWWRDKGVNFRANDHEWMKLQTLN